MWEAFAPHVDGGSNPLDRWTKGVIDPSRSGSVPAPSTLRAQRAAFPALGAASRDALCIAARHPDPSRIRALARLARRAALRRAAALPPRSEAAEPLRELRGEAVSFGLSGRCVHGHGLRCSRVRRTPRLNRRERPPADCHGLGCHARSACPVGREWRYPGAQMRFHMAAFAGRWNATVED